MCSPAHDGKQQTIPLILSFINQPFLSTHKLGYVASNRMGVYFEKGYGGPWDVAAGLLIVREAGGVVRTVSDTPFELLAGKGEVLCGNAHVCTAIAITLAEH